MKLTNLIESQKQFLKNSVHEINTPLAIIQTNIDLLKEKLQLIIHMLQILNQGLR
ncbi:MAG: histidine kinase dimerization/phospho-acceptor domain-containing protein [Halarcobacter ebronensis]